MKRKDVVALVYAVLGDVLGQHGFKLVKSNEAFIRKTLHGDQRLYVSIEDLAPSFVVTVVVGIRIDKVEEICHRFSGALPQHHGMSVSSITELGYFDGGEAREWTVCNSVQIDSALRDISALLLDRVVPFLDSCTDAESLDRIVNSPEPRKFSIVQLPYGAMTATALAWLVGNPRLQQLIEKFREEMSGFPTEERAKFDLLVSSLS